MFDDIRFLPNDFIGKHPTKVGDTFVAMFFGTGYGQKYEKQADGRWLKTEG